MVFSMEGFKHFKNILHPNIVKNSNEYLENRLYHLPPYHGCGKRNRNGTNKEIDYKRGEHCFFPTEKKYWKKKKKIQRKVKFTRYMSVLGTNFYAKTKKRMWFDYEQNCFKPRSNWFNNNDPYFKYNM